MRKVLAWLCVLCLMAGLAMASAEENAAVYMLSSVNEAGDATLLGTAVLLEDPSTLLTASHVVQGQERVVASGAGGTLEIASVEIPEEGGALALLHLAEPSPAQPLVMGDIGENMVCIAATENGLVSQTAQYVSLTGYGDVPALLYTGVERALPGAVLLNSQGEIAGITCAAYGEGLNRYVALNSEVMKAGLTKLYAWIKDFSVSVEKGEMTIEWARTDQLEMPEGSACYLIWQDTANHYVAYGKVQWENGRATVGCAPGRTYRVWMQLSYDGEVHLEQVASQNDAVTYTAEAAEPFTLYGYKDTSIYLGAAPAEQQLAETEEVPPVEHFNLAGLTDANMRYYLQVTSTYQVTEQIEASLLIALRTPDNTLCTQLGGFIFMPELNEGDVWKADITDLLAECMGLSGGMSGEYSLAYYLDGQLISEFLFNLE